MMLTCGDVLIVDPAARAEDRSGVATKNLNIWEKPRKSSDVLMTVPTGTRLTITGRARKGLYPVSVAGIDGWTLTGSVAIQLDEDRAEPARRRSQSQLRGFATEDLNLRSEPGQASRVRTIVPSGRPLELTGAEEDGYVAVVYDGETGWVAKEFV
jgi:uncharacterized protein YgiM (DUF1202 family)